MANVTYEKEIRALLVIDPYNDFISEGGKVWDRLKGGCRSLDRYGASAPGEEIFKHLGITVGRVVVEALRLVGRNSEVDQAGLAGART